MACCAIRKRVEWWVWFVKMNVGLGSEWGVVSEEGLSWGVEG